MIAPDKSGREKQTTLPGPPIPFVMRILGHNDLILLILSNMCSIVLSRKIRLETRRERDSCRQYFFRKFVRKRPGKAVSGTEFEYNI
jgi:hypothetical protein